MPGVTGGVFDGSRPKRARCVGVRGISARLSFGRNKGSKATTTFMTNKMHKAVMKISGALEPCSTKPDR